MRLSAPQGPSPVSHCICETGGEGLSYQGDCECFPGVHTILCFVLVVLTWVEGGKQGWRRGPPAKGLPDGRGPGLVVILLVLVHPHLCSALGVPERG